MKKKRLMNEIQIKIQMAITYTSKVITNFQIINEEQFKLTLIFLLMS